MSNNTTRRLAGCVYQTNHNKISVNLEHFKVTTKHGTTRSIYDHEVRTAR